MKDILQFQKNGFLVKRGIANDIGNFRSRIIKAKTIAQQDYFDWALDRLDCQDLRNTSEVLSESTMKTCLRRFPPDAIPPVPYVQYIHLHRKDPELLKFVAPFAQLASNLLQVPRIRLYQTTAFFKTPTQHLLSQATDWHRDLNLVPVDTNNYLTMWCPMKAIRKGGSILRFAAGSHRDVALLHWFNDTETDWSRLEQVISTRYSIEDHESYNVGDCSIHHGWIYHMANKNDFSETREAFAISFIDGDAKLLDGNTRIFQSEDELSWKDWIDQVYENNRSLDHPLLPLLWDASS
eukprot:TRINITY_DN7464_c0_g1_i1.p1 TRINITY_DN7464_c0_g1~~TRINITY_DN7464_c0_g1_i1.p1  ORF type:complete len:333 (+),score=76.45 TRINITY_DN7464_c0_g1_i1:118-999(+)